MTLVATEQRSNGAHLWQPGQSGNPAGSQPGLAKYIRDETRNGLELVEFVLGVFREGKRRERLEAATWLADRGFGKPAQTTLIAAASPLGAMSLDELIAYREEIRLERAALLAQQPQPVLPTTTTEAGG